MGIDLVGKPIAITGASSGIGAATALACARAGMPVTLAARRAERLRELADRIRQQGGQAIAVECDVADGAACRRVVEATVDAFGSIYAAFANAGYGYESTVADTQERVIREIFEVNFWGSLNLLRPALEWMTGADTTGHLVWCSSCLSKIGLPYLAGYCASKAAQDHFARAMRLELKGRGIHVSSVHPIGTKTELFDKLAERSGGRSRLTERTPDRFMQPPERVADAIVACLRRPRGEVWTSTTVRLGLAASVAFPGLADRILGRRIDARLARPAN